MLLAIKGSVCWSPSTAPAPRTVLAVLGERLVEMSECGTCQREKACLSCMARTGLSGMMVHGRRSLQMATGHHHCHASALLGHRTVLGQPHSSQPLLQRSFDLPGTCSRVLAVSPARERPGSRSKICREWSPQLVGAKVNALSGFRSHHSWNYP